MSIELFGDVQVYVVGKVFKPSRLNVSALNRTLNEYFRLVKWLQL
jgi:protein involved in polysaccharide export with SLBB domain